MGPGTEPACARLRLRITGRACGRGVERVDPVTRHGPVVVLVDDLRSFRDNRDAQVFRTSRDALHYLTTLGEEPIAELWLDHDLGDDDTISPVVELLQERAFNGAPMAVGVVYVHSMNPPAAEWIRVGLERFGYRTVRTTTDELVSEELPDTRS